MLWTPKTARSLAEFAHAGQVDKLGEDYRGHVIAVAQIAGQMYGNIRPGYVHQDSWQKRYVPMLPSAWPNWHHYDEQMHAWIIMTGYLHDLDEDTDIKINDLVRWRCPEAVVNGVDRLTFRPTTDSRDSYYLRIKESPLALTVKRADVFHNSHPTRLNKIEDPDTRARLDRKYLHATEVLAD